MKVVFITSDFPPGKGGISTLSKNLAETIGPKVYSFEIHVLFCKNKREEVDSEFKIPIHRSGTKSVFVNLLYVLKLCYRNKFSKTIYQTPNLFPVGFFIVVGCFIFGGFSVIHSHGTDFLSKLARSVVKKLKAMTLRLADKVIFISESTKTEVLKELKLKNEKVEVVYCPVLKGKAISKTERENARERLKINDEDFIIIRVGNLVFRKGDHLIIQALSKLPEKIKLFMVGDGPERNSLKNLTRSLGLENRVYFYGRVSDTFEYYNVSDLFIMASFYDRKEGDIEGLGIVILEAEGKGLPVIVADSGGMPEAIEKGETGFVFAENDSDDLAEKILDIYQNKDLQKKFRENGPEFVRDKFNSEKIANQYLEIYSKLLNKND